MTNLTPETIARLREFWAAGDHPTTQAMEQCWQALPKLLDAAEENVKLRELLKEFEFDQVEECHHCDGTRETGHEDDCEWKAVMQVQGQEDND